MNPGLSNRPTKYLIREPTSNNQIGNINWEKHIHAGGENSPVFSTENNITGGCKCDYSL